VRVIAATNRDLEAAVAAIHSQDLFYRSTCSPLRFLSAGKKKTFRCS